MAYTLDYSTGARKDIKAIRDRAWKRKIEEALLRLSEDPFAGDVLKMAGYRDVWRLRVGEWRICYRVDKGVLVVLVVGVAPRGEAYGVFGRRLE